MILDDVSLPRSNRHGSWAQPVASLPVLPPPPGARCVDPQWELNTTRVLCHYEATNGPIYLSFVIQVSISAGSELILEFEVAVQQFDLL